MKIGLFAPATIPTSFVVYLARVSALLADRGVTCRRFGAASELPRDVDLLWDVRSGGGNPPPDFLLADGLPPLVVTVHGFAPLSLPILEYHRSWRDRFEAIGHVRRQQRRWQPLQARIAAVIAVSDFTRGECWRHAGIEAQRVHVCHHGVDGEAFGQPVVPAMRDAATLLHVSNDEPRKNLARTVRAFARLRRSHPQARLVLKLPAGVGEAYRGQPGVELVSGHLSTEALAALYARATAFVFPSLYEGFGMPILEAMAAGCPVLTSTESACPEVAGSAALCVDPRNTAALAGAMARLLDDSALRERLVREGHLRAQAFTWAASASAHLAVFEGVLAGRR